MMITDVVTQLIASVDASSISGDDIDRELDIARQHRKQPVLDAAYEVDIRCV